MKKLKLNRNFVIGTAVGGVALLATALNVGVVNAQTTNSTANTILSRVATILGVDQTKLTDAVKQAKTEQIDQDVKDGKITQAQADKIKQDIADGKMGGGFGMGMEKGMRGGPEKGKTMDYLAEFLGVTDTDLRTTLQNNTKLSDYITSKGKTVADAKKYVTDKVKSDLDQQVKDGKITQTQEDDILSRESTMFDNFVNGTFPKFGGRRGMMNYNSSTNSTTTN